MIDNKPINDRRCIILTDLKTTRESENSDVEYSGCPRFTIAEFPDMFAKAPLLTNQQWEECVRNKDIRVKK
jgi:hypothetical protein